MLLKVKVKMFGYNKTKKGNQTKLNFIIMSQTVVRRPSLVDFTDVIPTYLSIKN